MIFHRELKCRPCQFKRKKMGQGSWLHCTVGSSSLRFKALHSISLHWDQASSLDSSVMSADVFTPCSHSDKSMNTTPIKFSGIWMKSFVFSNLFFFLSVSLPSPSASLPLSEFSSGFHHSWDKYALFCSTCHLGTPPNITPLNTSLSLPVGNEPLVFHIPSSFRLLFVR